MVFHAHFHVIPRNKDDKLLSLPQGSKSMLEPAEAQKMAAKIQENLDSPTVQDDSPTSYTGALVPALAATCAVLAGAVLKLSTQS